MSTCPTFSPAQNGGRRVRQRARGAIAAARVIALGVYASESLAFHRLLVVDIAHDMCKALHAAANTSLHGATDLKSGMGCTGTLSLASRMRSSFAMVVVENVRGLKRRAASTPRMIPVFMSSAP